MIWVYILTPILTVLLGVMFGAPLLFPVKKLMPEVQAELDREAREDGELAIVKRQFVNDEISMLELEEQVVQILDGTWTNRPSPYGTVAEITAREGYHRGAVTYMPPPTTPPPKPSDAGRAVRSYSYPAAPGWPDTDPPMPNEICCKDMERVECLCSKCKEQWYEELEYNEAWANA